MSELKKYKINKLLKFSNPYDFLCDEKNFSISKELYGSVDALELLKKNISPFSIDFKNNTVLFVETNKVISHNETAFMYVPLQKKSEYVIPVPFSELRKLVENTEIKDDDFLFIHHPGRCGSTLLHRVLGSNSNIESFSEDLISENLFWRMHSEGISYDKIKDVYTHILALLMIRWGDSGKKVISLKMGSYSHHYFNSILRMLPDSKHIYITRNPVDIAISMQSIFQSIAGFHYPYKKVELLNYFDLDYIHGDMIEKGDYGQYINKYITPQMKSVIGSMDSIECSILRVILIDRFFNSLKCDKMLYLTYNDLLNKEMLFDRLREYLQFEKNSYFKKDVYTKHSQTGKEFRGPNIKYFNLTDKQKKKYALFAKRVKQILNFNG